MIFFQKGKYIWYDACPGLPCRCPRYVARGEESVAVQLREVASLRGGQLLCQVAMKLFLAIGALCLVETSALVVPEDVASILSLIYFNIPPIFKGTDSRLGVGFALGRHADAQFLLELGPQIETQPLGKQPTNSNTDNKRRRFIESPVPEEIPLEYPKRSNNPLVASWISRWRNALAQTRPQKKIPIKSSNLPGTQKNNEKIVQLQQLYDNPTNSKVTIVNQRISDS